MFNANTNGVQNQFLKSVQNFKYIFSNSLYLIFLNLLICFFEIPKKLVFETFFKSCL